MMVQVFMAFIAFALALIAFCAGTWLTIWATSGNTQTSDTNAAKMAGYFISVLAILALVFTSYYTAKVVFTDKAQSYSKVRTWKGKSHSGSTQRRASLDAESLESVRRV